MMRCSRCGTYCQDDPCLDGNPDSHTPVEVHTCHGNEHMPSGPCVACEEDKDEQDALAGQSEADQAQEAADRAEFEWVDYQERGE
jgi:hypothetical protein